MPQSVDITVAWQRVNERKRNEQVKHTASIQEGSSIDSGGSLFQGRRSANAPRVASKIAFEVTLDVGRQETFPSVQQGRKFANTSTVDFKATYKVTLDVGDEKICTIQQEKRLSITSEVAFKAALKVTLDVDRQESRISKPSFKSQPWSICQKLPVDSKEAQSN